MGTSIGDSMGKMGFSVSGLFLSIVIICSAILTYSGHLRPVDFINIVFTVLGVVTALSVFALIIVRTMMD